MLPAMEKSFEELDYQRTALGELILRRRKVPLLGNQVVHEVILNEEFLMSSLFHEAEEALATRALALVDAPENLDVVVGGLGLGHTAAAALRDARVASVTVIEALQAVVDWHRRGLVPLRPPLAGDRRVVLRTADFFALSAAGDGFLADRPGEKVHAVLVDIDHTPAHWLHPDHAAFYTASGLEAVRGALRPGGVFGLWADGDPDPVFERLLASVFGSADGCRVEFPNPITDGTSASTVYLAVAAGDNKRAPLKSGGR